MISSPASAVGREGIPPAEETPDAQRLLAQLVVAQTRDLQAFVVLLQAFAGYLLYRAERLAAAQLHSVLARTSGLLDLFRRAGLELDFDQACRLALDALCVDLGCQRAS